MVCKRCTVALVALLMVLAAGCGKNAADPNAGPAAGSSSSKTTNNGTGSGSTSGTDAAAGSTTGSTGSSSTSKPTTATPAQKVKLGPLKMGEVANVGPIQVTLAEKSLISKAAGLPTGYGYLLVRFSIKNGGNATYTINATEHIKVEMPDGKAGRYNVAGTAQRTPRLSGTLNNGEAQDGWAGYLVKVLDGVYKLTFTHPDFGEATWEITL